MGAWPPGAQDKKAPLSAEEQKDFAQLQNDIELYKAKLRNEFGYSNKDIKAQRASTWDGWDRVGPLCTPLSQDLKTSCVPFESVGSVTPYVTDSLGRGRSRFEGHGEPPCGFPEAELRADTLRGLARRDSVCTRLSQLLA